MIAPLDIVAAATRMVLDEYADDDTRTGTSQSATADASASDSSDPTGSARELRALDPVAVSDDL
jgi:hypothetical protein